MTSRHDEVRPRYTRIGVAVTSFGVTLVAVLGGLGALPSAADEPGTDSSSAISNAAQDTGATTTRTESTPEDTSATPTEPEDTGADRAENAPNPRTLEPVLPARSGKGKRVVYSEGEQRVWLVRDNGAVLRTYLVSGSVYDNLDPGTYSVYSRSEQAWGIDDSGTMKYFVRFTQGDNAAIGFHDIPIDDGHKLQALSDLGTPQSHGCIRQKRADAIALWDFAPLGTTVVVTA